MFFSLIKTPFSLAEYKPIYNVVCGTNSSFTICSIPFFNDHVTPHIYWRLFVYQEWELLKRNGDIGTKAGAFFTFFFSGIYDTSFAIFFDKSVYFIEFLEQIMSGFSLSTPTRSTFCLVPPILRHRLEVFDQILQRNQLYFCISDFKFVCQQRNRNWFTKQPMLCLGLLHLLIIFKRN